MASPGSSVNDSHNSSPNCAVSNPACESGRVPSSPSTKRQRIMRRNFGDPVKRAAACVEFAENPASHRSIDAYVDYRRLLAQDGDWKPSKAQMSRDMNSIFGKAWSKKRRADTNTLIAPSHPHYFLEPNHKPSVLSRALEHRIVASLRTFEERFGIGIVTETLISSVAMFEILSHHPESIGATNAESLGAYQNEVNVAFRQLGHISKPGWIRSFLQRHKESIRKTVRKRALEQHKAAKHQIELVLAHLRNVYQAEALAQIQRHMVKTNNVVRGFVRFRNIIQRETTSDVHAQQSLLYAVDGGIIVRALEEPLQHVASNLRFALDETPVNPDSPLLQAYTTRNSVPLSKGRASIWTLLPVLCGNGSVIASLLLQRCRSIPIDAAKFTAANGLCVAATENAQQSDESWLNFAKIWLPLCACSYSEPGFVYIDGHSSHITRSFIELAAQHAIYVVVEPSHTSMVLQVADIGINRFLKNQYAREYTSSICACSVTGRSFDDVERIGCVVRTLHALKDQSDLVVSCFVKSGLLCGYKDVYQHFPPSLFSSGVSMRDPALPQVNTGYIKAVLSIENLAAVQGDPVIIPESFISDQLKTLSEYAVASEGFRKFYFALGATADLNTDDSGENNGDILVGNVRRLFKLGRARNVPRGAPGRVSTAYGSLASSRDQWDAAVMAEQAAVKAAAEKTARQNAKEIAARRERPLEDILISTRYKGAGERLTKKVLLAVFENNKGLLDICGLSTTSSRAAMIEALLSKHGADALNLVPLPGNE